MSQGIIIGPVGPNYTLQANPVEWNYLLYSRAIQAQAPFTLGAGAIAFGYTVASEGYKPALTLALSPLSFTYTPQTNLLRYNTAPNTLMGGLISYGAGAEPNLEGLAIFKNRCRESRGWTLSGSVSETFVPYTAAGWPSTDFGCLLIEGIGNVPGWMSSNGGVFTGGFIGTGTETISSYGGGVVSNVVHGTGGAYTTFNLTYTSGGIFGFQVTGTTGGVTDIFANLPAYPATSIDNPASASAITNEAASHFSNFNHLRMMDIANADYAVYQGTVTNRHSLSNTQVRRWGQGTPVTAATLPGAGASSFVLASPWSQATGYYGTQIVMTSGAQGPVIYLKNGSTAAPDPSGGSSSWIGAPLAAAAAYQPTTALEGFPIEWQVAIASAAGCGLWINPPLFEDGVNYTAASWSTAVFTYIRNNFTGPVYIEPSNEVWNPGQLPYFVANNLSTVLGFSSYYTWFANQLVRSAQLAKTIWGSAFGVTVKMVYAWQSGTGGLYGISQGLAYINTTYGAPNQYIGFIAQAPYINTSGLPADASIAQIEANLTAQAQTQTTRSLSEQYAILGMYYGIALASYEGGWQVNAESGSQPNIGATVTDPGITAVLQTYYNTGYNNGFVLRTHSALGVALSSTNPQDSESNVWSQVIAGTAPVSEAILSYPSPPTLTRNVIAAPGTYSVQITVTGSGTTNLQSGNAANGYTNVATGVAINNNTVNLGNVTLVKGANYILLGKNGAQAGITLTNLSVGGTSIPLGNYADAIGAANPTFAANTQAPYNGENGYLGYLINVA